ncbi:MAG: histidine phosphatase family protein [Thiotrichales bacterium]|nr:MAG: histidine phosphatase family protein [Thiotrichales bacterium]
MSRTLILLRHGKSDWSTGDADFERPLKKRGRNASRQAGTWLHSHNLAPDFVITSPARRALQTAEICCETMGIRKKNIYSRKHIYLATPEELLYVLEDCPVEAKRVMLVGHNPGLEELLYFLINGQMTIPEDGKIMPTATVAVLDMPDHWSKLQNGSANLEFLVRPREIS